MVVMTTGRDVRVKVEPKPKFTEIRRMVEPRTHTRRDGRKTFVNTLALDTKPDK